MDNPNFKEIVSRYFRGQLVDSEYELLTEGLQDKLNREYFEKAKKEWENNPELDETGNRNLNRLNYQINNETISPSIPITRRLLVRISSVAAILLLGLFAGSMVTYLAYNKSQSEQLVFETPRGEKSYVKLPDGTEVWLNAKSRLVYNTFSPNHREEIGRAHV